MIRGELNRALRCRKLFLRHFAGTEMEGALVGGAEGLHVKEGLLLVGTITPRTLSVDVPESPDVVHEVVVCLAIVRREPAGFLQDL